MISPDFEAAAHLIQLALTPVFLLSGIATLIGAFALRLGRVADKAEIMLLEPESKSRSSHLRMLWRRTRMLDWAVLLAACAAVFTCGAVLTLFIGGLRGANTGSILFLLFGGGIALTICSLAAFTSELLLATTSIRANLVGTIGQL